MTEPLDTAHAPQGQLFDSTRYSPIRVAVFTRLPESNARTFQIASALGSFLGATGSSSDRVRSGRQVTGVVIRKKRLKVILQAIGIKDRQWRRYAADWEARYLAHRCHDGNVCLFSTPLMAECPSCHEDLKFDHQPPSYKTNRGPGGLANGRTSTDQAVVSRPQRGPGTTEGAVQERPLPERASAPPPSGSLLGLGVGVRSESQVEPFPAASPEVRSENWSGAREEPDGTTPAWRAIQRREDWTPESDEDALARVLDVFPDAVPIEEVQP